MGRLITSLQNEWATFRFWLATKRFQKDRDYVVHKDEDDIALIEILRGKFKGIKFAYGAMHLTEADGTGSLEFRTYVLYNPHDADITSKKFNKLTSNILRVLLQEVARESINEARENDSAESDEERGVREKSTPVLERRVSRGESRKESVSGDTELHPEIQQASKRKRSGTRTARKIRPNRK